MTMKNIYNILVAFLLVLSSGYSYSQAAPCSPVSLSGQNMGTTYTELGNCSWTSPTGAVVDPACGSVTANAGEYWIMYSQINDESYFTFDLNPTTGGGSNPIADPAFQVYTQPSGTCNTASWTYTLCSNDNDGTGTNGEAEQIAVTAGTDYYIRIFDADGEMDCAGGGRNDEFTVLFNHEQTNDAICEAVSLTPNSGCTTWDNGGAGNPSGGNGSCFSEANVVWFSFVATNDSMTVSTDFAGSELTLTDTDIAIFSSSDNTCTGTFTEVGCDTDGGLGCTWCSLSEMTGLTVGDTYFVMVDGFSTQVGTFCVAVYETPPPPLVQGSACDIPHQMYSHDACFSSTVYGNNGYTPDASGYGNSESIDQSCSTDDDSSQNGYWTTFTAVDANTTIDIVDTTPGGVANFMDVSIYTGTCGSLTEVDCQSLPTNNNSFVFAGTPGTEYIVLMTNGTAYSGNVRQISICGSSACSAPTNDACGSALSTVDGTTYTLTNACATADLGMCSGSTENNVWISWTAGAGWTAGDAAFVTLANQDCYNNESGTGGSQLSIFNSTEDCSTISGLDPTECVVYNNPNNQNNFNANFIANPGETFYMTIDGYGGDGCTYNFQINNTAPVIVLPAEMITFTGEWDQATGNNLLHWATASEANCEKFILEGSEDGFFFTEVAILNGAGNSTVERSYHAKDFDPYIQTYYRVKQVDYDGKYYFSDIITVKQSMNNDDINIYPNPNIDGQLYIEFPGMNQEYNIKVYDLTGKIVSRRSGKANGSVVKLQEDFSSYPRGIYMVEYSDGNTVLTNKLVLR